MRELGKLYVAKLQELGLATKRAINGLKEELTQGLRGINAQIDAIGKWANTTQRQKRPGGIVNLPYRKDDEQAPGTRAPDLRGTLPPSAADNAITLTVDDATFDAWNNAGAP